jgi:serine protease Do
VLAVGNPMGLESTVTEGIISSTGRYVDIFDEGGAKPKNNYAISNFIQTDAAINPGNSGGGLFNIRGEVVGINAAIASQTGTWMGYGFAIPINMAKSVVTDLIKTGKVNRGYIGVQIGQVDQTMADAIGLDRPRGVLVDKVIPGQAGDLAGLKSNDVILSVDGHEVEKSNELQSVIGMHHAGDKVMLHIWRDGKEFDKSVTLKPRTDTDEVASKDKGDEEEQPAETSTKTTATLDNIGLTVRTVTDDEKDKFGITNGVMITNEAMASESMDRGLPRGWVITEAAHHKVKSAGDFEDIINANKGKAVGLTVVDDKGDSHFFAIRVPND